MGASNRYSVYGLTIVGDDQYRLAVELALRNIETSYTGKVLLMLIKSTGRSVQISPWANPAECNATASATDFRGATPSGQYVLKGGGSFMPMGEPSLIRNLLGLPLEPIQGTGRGSDVVVNFTPTMFGFGAAGACASVAGSPGASPSLVLFHELAHAYRQARGKLFPRPTIGTSRRYDNMEEFFAIVLSNVLVTDPTFATENRALRADHHTFSALPADMSSSRGFVASTPNRNMMRELVASEPVLVQRLRGSKSTFNPFVESLSGDSGGDAATHTILKGESLSGLAKSVYGDAELWPILYDCNKSTVGPNPNKLSVGQSLSVPAKQKLTLEQIKKAKETARRAVHPGIKMQPLR